MLIGISIMLAMLAVKLLLDCVNAFYYRQKFEELLEQNKTRFIDVFSISVAKEFLKRRAG